MLRRNSGHCPRRDYLYPSQLYRPPRVQSLRLVTDRLPHRLTLMFATFVSISRTKDNAYLQSRLLRHIDQGQMQQGRRMTGGYNHLFPRYRPVGSRRHARVHHLPMMMRRFSEEVVGEMRRGHSSADRFVHVTFPICTVRNIHQSHYIWCMHAVDQS